MNKKSFKYDANHTINEDKKMQKKKQTCWYCKFRGNNILDEFGCCKRCGTNITRWKKRRSLPYPQGLLESKKGDKALDLEVLGHRERFVIPEDDEQGDW